MATFERLRIFYYVAKEGSIRRACPLLETTENRISRYLLDLEQELQQKLFIRKKTGLDLTLAGAELFSSIQVSINNLEEALKNFGKEEHKTKNIKILTTTGVISILLSQICARFLKKYKDIDIKIYTTNEDIDFKASTVDIGLLPKLHDQPGLSQHKLVTLHSRLFASPKYIQEHGMPKNLQELSNHQLVGFYPDLPGNRGNADWHLKKDTEGKYRHARFAINSVIGQYEAVRAGLGIFAVAKEFPFIEEGGLVPVLPEEDSVNFDVYFIKRADKFPSREIELFYNFLKEELRNIDA